MSPIPKIISCCEVLERFPLSPNISSWILPLKITRFSNRHTTDLALIAKSGTFFKALKEFFVAKRLVDKAVLQLILKSETENLSYQVLSLQHPTSPSQWKPQNHSNMTRDRDTKHKENFKLWIFYKFQFNSQAFPLGN